MLSFKQFLLREETNSIKKTELGNPNMPGTTVHGVHYSHSAGLSELHGYRWGSGIKGREQERLAHESDQRLKNRVYFYNRKSDTHLPIAEAGLGQHVHSSILHGIYEPSKATPEQRTAFAEVKKKHMPPAGLGYDESELATAFEKAVIDSGYHGYSNGHITVVLNQKVVPTKYEGPRWQLKQAA